VSGLNCKTCAAVLAGRAQPPENVEQLRARIVVLETSLAALANLAGAHQHEGNGRWVLPVKEVAS